MEKHSEKGLKTLELMGTVPTEWGFAPIKWEKKERLVSTDIPCPHCGGFDNGNGYPRMGDGWGYKKEGKFMSRDEASKMFIAQNNGIPGGYVSDKRLIDSGYVVSVCPHCQPSRKIAYVPRVGNFPRSAGYTVEPRLREVWVGRVLWAEGTLMDSRFRGCDCELCGKNMIRSGRVPINGKGADGRIHGAWVGLDCAKKFYGLKKFNKPKGGDYVIDGAGE